MVASRFFLDVVDRIVVTLEDDDDDFVGAASVVLAMAAAAAVVVLSVSAVSVATPSLEGVAVAVAASLALLFGFAGVTTMVNKARLVAPPLGRAGLLVAGVLFVADAEAPAAAVPAVDGVPSLCGCCGMVVVVGGGGGGAVGDHDADLVVGAEVGNGEATASNDGRVFVARDGEF
eukprot:scaffold98417_cov61-Attheya_sp.AAC.4